MTEQAPTELGRFLRARREGVRPGDAGLPAATASRRTPGLRYEVRRGGDGEKAVRHPAVGTLTLAREILDVNRADGQRLVVSMALPGPPTTT